MNIQHGCLGFHLASIILCYLAYRWGYYKREREIVLRARRIAEEHRAGLPRASR